MKKRVGKIGKRWIILCLVFALVSQQGCMVTIAKQSDVKVKAHAYVILDAKSGKTLYSQNGNKRIYPASTVKLMTALVVLENAKMTDKITFTKEMAKYWESDVSTLDLKAGAKYQVKEYLNMLLIWSDADAALALAKGVCGSVPKFVGKMNKKAKSMGMSHTRFDNPVGLDKGNGFYQTYTTANDFAILAQQAMKNSVIRSIVKKAKYKVPKTSKSKSFTIHSSNGFLSKVDYDSSLYTIIGTKTGTTRAAGHVLITTATDKKGHEVICLFFGKSTVKQMYSDIRKLLNDVFRKSKKGTLVLKGDEKPQTTTEVPATTEAVVTEAAPDITEVQPTEETPTTTEVPGAA